MWLLGQEKLILSHNEPNYGTNKVTFWDRRSWYWVITRQIMGQNKVTFWDRRSWYWVITRWIMGQNKVTFWDRRSRNWVITRQIMGQNKMIFWDRRSWYIGSYQDEFWDRKRLWGQEKSILSHNKTNYGTWRCDFFGQEKLILDHNKMNCRTKQGHFLGYWKVIHIRRWSYGRFWDDNNIFHKMKKWPNYRDMAGRYLMPHKYHLVWHFWCCLSLTAIPPCW